MEVVVSVLAGLVGLLVVVIVNLILGRVKAQDEKIERLASKELVDVIKQDLKSELTQLRTGLDNFNLRHTDKNHKQDGEIRKLEAEQARQGEQLAGIEKRQNGGKRPDGRR